MKQTLPSVAAPDQSPAGSRQSSALAKCVLLSALSLLGMQQSFAQTTPTVIRVGNGSAADYRTLTEALQNVPSPLTRPYEIQILNRISLNESVTISHRGTAINTLVIKPAAGAVAVSIDGTITFNGASYVTLSGNNGSATTRELTVSQASTSQPAILLTNDATNVTVSGTNVLGNYNLSTGGILEIRSGTITGNDNNTFTGNYIANQANNQAASNLVFVAQGIGAVVNDGISLVSNELANYSRAGIMVSDNNGDGWRILDNSFYYSLNAQPTTAQTAVNFLAGTDSDNNAISGNFIGGTAPQALGSTWTNGGNNDFRGIVVDCGTGSGTNANIVQNNTVRNINLSQASTQSFQALLMNAGRTELTNNSTATVVNNGSGGVNALVARGTVVLNEMTVPAGQIMLVQNGLSTVNGELFIRGTVNHTGGDIIINGDFTNFGSFAQTLGNLEVKGDMNNFNVFSCTTGGVMLTGNGPQSVSGGLYYNLEIRGSGVKTLTQNAMLANNLVMNGGILNTGTRTITFGADAFLSETATSYVIGRIEVSRLPRRGVTETFGNIGLSLTPAAGSVLPGTTVVERITGTATSGNGNQGIKRYFDITAATNTGLNATMRIDYLAHELNGIAPADLVFFKSTDNGANWQPKGISSSGTNFAVLENVDGFSRWTLGSRLNPLPVGLTAFRAQRQQQDVVLTWATATEVNNRGFGVEVSTDGHAYRQLTFVAGQEGSSTTARNYRYTDTEAGKQGVRYYRLRQEDTDGKVTYLATRTVFFEAGAAMAAYPTAFDRSINVELVAPVSGAVTFTLADVMGRVVWTQQQAAAAGQNRLTVEPTCKAGTYILTAVVGGQRFQQRVVRK